jgi:CheY-like chemotaxis protein
MANRLALIVDDSKTARVTLSRMLEKYNIAVDTLESAGDALKYLHINRPDVIFMDHMMPGMDGFQAIEAIKGNPATATIPIMMYTSKGGDLYLSQARALGAVGILPKQVQPAELFKVLNNLGLVRDRRAQSQPQPADSAPAAGVEGEDEWLSLPSDTIEHIAQHAAASVGKSTHLHSPIREMLDRQYTEFRKELRASHEGVARQVIQAILSDPDDLVRAIGDRAKRSSAVLTALKTALLVFLMAVPAMWLYGRYDDARHELAAASSEIASLRNAHEQREVSADEETMELRRTLEDQVAKASSNPVIYSTIEWAINEGNQYGVDEIALSDRRLAIITGLVSRLKALGFAGTVRLVTHLGEFCLTGNDTDGYTLAADDTPVQECNLIGHPDQQLPSLGQRQSIDFATFLSTSPLVNEGDIQVEIVAAGYDEPLLEYPARGSDLPAGEWNRIAARNNRVEIRLIPSSE